ncbi:hypothetical protein EMCRGX_G016086 [Ephydatia muelleri]|eukprot:Em0008g1106a
MAEAGATTSNSNLPRFLFGGAFTCVFPQEFQNVSTFREIPDNQEVFSHIVTDQSIIFELVEYEDIPDDQIAQFHFKELTAANDASTSTVVSVDCVPTEPGTMDDCSAIWLLSGQQAVAKFNEPDSGRNLVDLYLAVFRLEQYQTDMLVTLNNPVLISQCSSSAVDNPPLQTGALLAGLFREIVQSLRLVDSSIFGETTF